MDLCRVARSCSTRAQAQSAVDLFGIGRLLRLSSTFPSRSEAKVTGRGFCVAAESSLGKDLTNKWVPDREVLNTWKKAH